MPVNKSIHHPIGDHSFHHGKASQTAIAPRFSHDQDARSGTAMGNAPLETTPDKSCFL